MPSERIDIPTRDGTADAYLAGPDGAPGRGVLLMIDAWGLRPQIEAMADRIAGRGYTVLAPNLFYRGGRAPVVPMPDLASEESRAAAFEQLRPLMAALTPENITADGAAYLQAVGEHSAPGPIGVTGYCLGARLGMRLAAAYPDRIAALGGFHGGGLVTDEADSPHRAADRIRAEVFFGHADGDRSNTPEQIAALDAALDAAGVRHRSEVYPGAAHGYTMADTPAYDEAAAERHFEDLFTLFGRALPRA